MRTTRLLRLFVPLLLLTPAATLAATLTPAEYLALRLDADDRYAARDTSCIALYRRLLMQSPDDGEMMARMARILGRAGRREEALDWGKRALEAGFANRQAACYDQAAQAAREGRRDAALEWIERALAARLEDRPWFKSDSDFESMRDDPRFQRLAGILPPGAWTREEGWRHDLDFFLEEARRLHAAPDRRAHAPEFERGVRDLQARVAALDDPAVAMEVQKLIVRHLGDGHSVLYPMPTPHVSFGMLPVQFYFFSDGLFVVSGAGEYERLAGRRVVAINGKPADRIAEALRAVVSRDNDYGLLWIGPLYLQVPAALRAIGYGEALDHASLTLRDGRRTETVRVEVGEPYLNQKLVAPPGRTPPPWLARAGEPYWSEALPSLNAVYAQVNQIQNTESGPTLAAFVERLGEELRRTKSPNLILDLRLNNGGDNFLVWPLVRLAAWHEMEGDGRRTWVLTGRNTVSACQNLVNRLERTTRAVFLGEPAGSRPNMVGEESSVELPWSGLRLSISSRYFQDSEPRDERPYVPVAVSVPYSSRDWLEGKDPVMETLAAHLRKR